MLEPAVLVHHFFHGEGGDTTQNSLTERTAQDFVDTAALRLGLLSLLRRLLIVPAAKQATEEIVEGVVVRLAGSARLLLRHPAAKETTQQPAEHVVRAKPPLTLWCLSRLRIRLRLGRATAEETAEETTQHVVHTAGLGAAAAFGRVRMAGALDSDHSRARLPPLQHFGKGFALVIRQIADRLHGRTLHNLGWGFGADLAQVVDRLLRREAFGGVARGVAIDVVLGLGDLFWAVPPAFAPAAPIAAPLATGLFRRLLRALSVVHFPAPEQSFQLVLCHRFPWSPSFWLTAGIPTLSLVALAVSIAAPVSVSIIGSIGDREYHPNRGGTNCFRQTA